MFTKPITAAATAVGLVLAGPLAGTALAQEAPAAPQAYSEDDLSAFIAAAVAVAEVEEQYRGAIASAESSEEQQELITSANTEIMETIESTPGISVDGYIEIAQAARADPALNERLMLLLQERQPAD